MRVIETQSKPEPRERGREREREKVRTAKVGGRRSLGRIHVNLRLCIKIRRCPGQFRTVALFEVCVGSETKEFESCRGKVESKFQCLVVVLVMQLKTCRAQRKKQAGGNVETEKE
jgi:hypothetical protein